MRLKRVKLSITFDIVSITLIPIILLLVLPFVDSYPFNKAYANTIDDSSSMGIRYDYWNKTLPTLLDNLQGLRVMRTFIDSEEIYPFTKQEDIYGLALSGSIQLNSEISLVQIILVDENLHEYLVYETYPLIAPGNSYSIKDTCEETCLLESIKPFSLKIEMIDASIHIDELSFSSTAITGKNDLPSIQKYIKKTQDDEKVARLNNYIKKKGLKWIAGQTSISQLSYEEKKKLFGMNKVPNLQGAEYYKGGVLEIRSQDSEQIVPGNSGSSTLIKSFDWRNRHGANNPDSPYYDGDSTGSGWITPVKSQGCNHCWAFSAVGATEALVNLYFNQHLDIDLSEQDAASCSGGEIKCCNGGYVDRALDYFTNSGVVDEDCFPYSASCESCSNRCSYPNEQIRINGTTWTEYNEEAYKRAIITHGPITAGPRSWWHSMVIIGFDKDPEDGQTIWIFKNSWGTDWGENGYGYLKIPLSDLSYLNMILTPIISLITPHEVGCYDLDGDGYYNWGIGSLAISCPPGIPTQKDCDDSNPNLGPFDANGNCTLLETITIPTTLGGPTSGITNNSYSYSTGGSTSNFGHPIEYQFDWKGDESDLSSWGLATQSKTWTVAGIYNVRSRARCTIDTNVISSWSGTLSVTITVPETVSTPTTLIGPPNGTIGKSYAYSTGGSNSSYGHCVQYFFDWGDGTNSGWLSVGTITASKAWSSTGTYLVKVQARCGIDTAILSNWSETLSIAISMAPITLRSPSDQSPFNACSLYSPSTFSLTTGETFRSYEVQFSPDVSFTSTPMKVRVLGTATQIRRTSSIWKKVLSILEGKVYWRVVGTRANRTIATSEAFSIIVEATQPVAGQNISSTSRTSLPTLSWENNCNTKFKVWFGSDEQFSKKTSFAFNIKNPNDNEGEFTKILTSLQWRAIRRLVGDISGSTIYWYVESWDDLGRYNKTDMMEFVLTD